MREVRKNLKEYRTLLDKKEISAEELYNEFLNKAKELNNELLALCRFIENTAEEEVSKAQKAIDENKSTALTGIPFTVKDDLCTEGLETTCNSKMLKGFIPPFNAAVIETLKEEKAVLLGKNTLDEFGIGSLGGYGEKTARNPYDNNRVCGGSSSGSAAAVSAGITPFAVASDYGGGVRLPAAFCGVVGFKPSFGRVSRHGLICQGSSFGQVGVICNNVYDAGYVMNSLSGYDKRDVNTLNKDKVDFTSKIGQDIKGLKIGIPGEFFNNLNQDIKKSVMSAVSVFEKNGAEIIEVSLPSFEFALGAYYIISNAETASNLGKFDGIKYGLVGRGKNYEERIFDSRTIGFGTEVKKRILSGNLFLSGSHYEDYFLKAHAVRQKIVKEYSDIFNKVDIIITPTALNTAPEFSSVNDEYLQDMLNVSSDIALLPSLSLPCGYSEQGLPIGLSITSKRFNEEVILSAGDFFEQTFTKILPTVKGRYV